MKTGLENIVGVEYLQKSLFASLRVPKNIAGASMGLVGEPGPEGVPGISRGTILKFKEFLKFKKMEKRYSEKPINQNFYGVVSIKNIKTNE